MFLCSRRVLYRYRLESGGVRVKLELTDQEIQKLVGTELKKRLRAAGFRMGAPMGELCSVWIPVHLDMAAGASCERTDDGIWHFEQIDGDVERRIQESRGLLYQAITEQQGKQK
jgi:hypothetical protein